MDAKKIMAIAIVAILIVAGVGILFLLNDDENAELKVSYLKKSAYETQIIAESIDVFSEHDLDVESVAVSGSGSDSVNLLLTGEVDIANTGEGPVASAIKKYGKDITCIAFMGGDADPKGVNQLALYIHETYPEFKVAWYSGRIRITSAICKTDFNYIKIGPYIKHLGPLKEKTTNQRLYRLMENGEFEDITSRFWKK